MLCTVAQMYTGTQAISFPTTGEDLNHTANGICPVNGGTGPSQHFDALDLINRQCFQRGTAAVGAVDTHTINQYQTLG